MRMRLTTLTGGSLISGCVKMNHEEKVSIAGGQERDQNVHEESVQRYREGFSVYEEFTQKLAGLVSELLDKHAIRVAQIAYRTKSPESFCEKIKRPDKSFADPINEVNDLIGIRIVTYYREDIRRIGQMIQEEFDVDWHNSHDTAQSLDTNMFGYTSVHYVVSLGADRLQLTEWELFHGLRAEIQVRTVLQHAWAEIQHVLVYKQADEVPEQIQRQMFRLSALLELTDEQFSNIRKLLDDVEHSEG